MLGSVRHFADLDRAKPETQETVRFAEWCMSVVVLLATITCVGSIGAALSTFALARIRRRLKHRKPYDLYFSFDEDGVSFARSCGGMRLVCARPACADGLGPQNLTEVHQVW